MRPPGRPRKTERDQRMREMRRNGATVGQLAAEFGVGPGRVRQIVNGIGSPARPPRRTKQRAPQRSRYFRLAHSYVSVAIYNGDLPKLDGSIKCVDCDQPAAEYDHRDYKKPMEVEPVCRACNQARGPGLHRDPSECAEKPETIWQRFNRRRA